MAERKPVTTAGLSTRDRSPQQSDKPALGMMLAPIDDALRQRLGLKKGDAGVVVTEVTPDGPAADQGVRPGDVIIAVNQKLVSDPQQVLDQIKEVKRAGRSAALLRINREGAYHFIAVPV